MKNIKKRLEQYGRVDIFDDEEEFEESSARRSGVVLNVVD